MKQSKNTPKRLLRILLLLPCLPCLVVLILLILIALLFSMGIGFLLQDDDPKVTWKYGPL